MRRLHWKPTLSMLLYLQFFSKTVDPSVTVWSGTFNSFEKCYASIEKKVAAIAEAVRRWSHYLLLRKFIIIINQNFVVFMFGKSRRNKIKNDKTMWWNIENKSELF